MEHVNRTCGLCGNDQVSGGLVILKNALGNGVGLFGECCAHIVNDLIVTLNSLHGAYYENGVCLASPRGTPNATSVEALRLAIDARRDENNNTTSNTSLA